MHKYTAAARAFACAFVVVAGAGSGPLSCRADDAAAAIQWNGFVSTSWGYNFNRPASGHNTLRVFDTEDNTISVDVVELVAQRAVAKPRDGGFRVDVTAGSSIPRVAASLGLFRTDSTTGDLDVHQAFASWIAPVGSGLRFDAGKFVTPFGYEVIEGYDGWNDNATRSLQFGYALPFTHTGVRAGYTFSPHVAALALVTNGWDVARDNNHSKSVGAQVTLTAGSRLTLTAGGILGPERAGNDSDLRGLADVVAIVHADATTTFAFNGDWGYERGIAYTGNSPWAAYALYARTDAGHGFAITLRGEYFRDRDGARTGYAGSLTEVTVTPEVRLSPKLLVRADLRADRAHDPVFEFHDSGALKVQPTVLLNVVGSF